MKISPARLFPRSKSLAAFLCLGLGLVIALPARHATASTIVDWGGDYVAAYAELAGGTPSSSAGSSTWLYSETIRKNPDASVYSGPAFYGAFSVINGSGSGTPTFSANRFGVSQVATGDQFRFGAAAPAGSDVTMRGLVFFKKQDFLGTASASNNTVNFDENSVLSLQVNSLQGSSGRSVKMAVYALVEGEWNWYLSADSITGTTSMTIDDPATASWGLYSIGNATAPLNGNPASYEITGSSFEELGAVGFFFNTIAPTGENATLFLSSFSVEAHVVPEPSPTAFLFGGMTVTAAFCLLKRKR